MLCRPAWSPLSASRRFPAGRRRSSNRPAASKTFSFRCTTRQSSRGIRRAARVFRSRNRSTADSSRKDWITHRHATRHPCNCSSPRRRRVEVGRRGRIGCVEATDAPPRQRAKHAAVSRACGGDLRLSAYHRAVAFTLEVISGYHPRHDLTAAPRANTTLL